MAGMLGGCVAGWVAGRLVGCVARMCLYGSEHTLLIFLLQLFFEKKIFELSYGAHQCFQNIFLEKGGPFIALKNVIKKRPLSSKGLGFIDFE